MSLWDRLRTGLSLTPKDPEPVDILGAHLDAYLERYALPKLAQRKTSGQLSLTVVAEETVRVVVVESRLSRVEISGRQDELVVRVLGDSFLPGVKELTESKQKLLSDLGLRRETNSDFAFSWDLQQAGGSRQLARRIESLLVELLDHGADDVYSVAIEPQRSLDNSQLIDSIQQLVKRQDFDARRLVYQAFLNSALYLPVAPPAEQLAPTRVRPWRQSGMVDKGEDWAVFSDLEALLRGGMVPEQAQLVSGLRLVAAAEAHGIAALMINPKSRIGGEFLRNEIGMMGDYLRKLGIRA